MVAGATGIDLFLLVIDAAEGARPQTHEHLAILRLLGIDHGVVAVTKADAVDAETLELRSPRRRELVPEAEAVAVSAKTGDGLDELRAALARAADGVDRRTTTAPTRLYVDRVVHAARDRHSRHRHALVGDDRRGRRAAGRAARPGRARAQRPGARPRGRAGRGGPAGRGRAPRDRARPDLARRRAGRAGALPASPTGWTSRSRSSATCPPPSPSISARRMSRRGSLARSATRSSGSSGRWSRPGATASSCARPRPSAAASSSIPLPPRRLDADRLERLERGELGATSTRPSARRTLSAPRRARGRRACRRLGLLARLARGAARTERRPRSRRPTRATPGSTHPSAPWAAAIVPLLGLERRGSRLYAPGATAQTEGADELLAELELVGVQRRSRSTTPGSRGRSSRRASSSGSATTRWWAPPRTSRHGRRSSRSAQQPAGSRSRASATCSGSAAARHSSCSNASTPTASPAGSATRRVLRRAAR